METLIVLNNVLEDIRKHAVDEYPDECCGLLIGNRRGYLRQVIKVIQLENSEGEETRQKNYQVDPRKIYHIEKELQEENLEIVGIYHSHPEGEAIISKKDERFMIPDLSYLIVSIYDKGNGNKTIRIKSYVKNGKYEVKEEYIRWM